MNSLMMMYVALAAGILHRNGGDHTVIIGKDTRLPGYMIESALVSGFTAAGMHPRQTGPVPTPAVAMLTRSMSSDLGVMITASHNPYQDIGVKLFGPDGFKIKDEMEAAIEGLVAKFLTDFDFYQSQLAPTEKVGKNKFLDGAGFGYSTLLKHTFPQGLSLRGMTVVFDGANGAGYKIGPHIFKDLHAKVIEIGVRPNGININEGCGSTDIELLRATVTKEGADIGLALDGDGDRLIAVDEKGQVIDGDAILALLATLWKNEGRLMNGGVVSTHMANTGLENYLGTIDLHLARTAVGDRPVLEHMRKYGYNIGGEQSGHMLLTDYATTGDGLLAGLQLLAAIKKSGKKASEACKLFTPLPQLLRNIRRGKAALNDNSVQSLIRSVEERILGKGRILVRPSGTEPVVRVMVEHEELSEAQTALEVICNAIQQAPLQEAA